MSETAVKKVTKPQLRGLLHSSIKRNLVVVGISMTIAGVYMHFIHNAGIRQKYVDFFRDYNIEQDFDRMRKKGLFQSCDDVDE